MKQTDHRAEPGQGGIAGDENRLAEQARERARRGRVQRERSRAAVTLAICRLSDRSGLIAWTTISEIARAARVSAPTAKARVNEAIARGELLRFTGGPKGEPPFLLALDAPWADGHAEGIIRYGCTLDEASVQAWAKRTTAPALELRKHRASAAAIWHWYG